MIAALVLFLHVEPGKVVMVHTEEPVGMTLIPFAGTCTYHTPVGDQPIPRADCRRLITAYASESLDDILDRWIVVEDRGLVLTIRGWWNDLR